MIQNYRLLKESATKFEEYRGEGETSSPQIQKIYSTAHFIVMSLRFKGVTKFLYLGRGGRFQGIYWFSKLPDVKYRIQKDKLLEIFRKYIRSSRINSLTVAEHDRLFILKCGNKYKYSNLYWFIKGSKAYVSVEYQLDGENPFYYHLWETRIQKRENAPIDFLVEFEALGFNKVDLGMSVKDKPAWTEEEYFEFLEKESEIQLIKSKTQKKILRKIENIKKDIIKIEKGLELEKMLASKTFKIPEGHKIKLCGIKFIFKSDATFFQKRDLIYKKLKRLKWAYLFQYERLDELVKNKKNKQDVNLVKNIVQPVWFHRNKESELRKKALARDQEKNFDRYKIRENLELAVGKNAKGNDHLRNKWGHKNDMWFHVEGYTGSHIIVKGDLVSDDFTLIGSILRDYSKLQIDDIPLIYARLSKVKGLKGCAGAVTIKNPKHIQVIYQSKWRDSL
ncbi:MAG: hypothetical protein HN576_02045 [Bacteriovoracaceae bacterium]|jgi:hypothetical protein|nr:hypothetical protein [Bacteriovoracaceae bacterium]